MKIMKRTGTINTLNTLLEGKPDNLFVVVKTTIEKGKGKFFINALSPSFVLDKIIDFINESSYKSVILVCRSYKEHYCKPCPPLKDIDYLEKNINKHTIFFYQDPFPAEVPDFNPEHLVIRFGFDNGCYLDKKCATDPNFDSDLESGDHYFLISKNKTIYIK